MSARKLDEADDVVKVNKISRAVRIKIQQARQAKGWTQAELAQKINEKVTVVQEYEAGACARERANLRLTSAPLSLQVAPSPIRK